MKVIVCVLAVVLSCRCAHADPAQVQLFAEAGCPYCAHFTVATVAPMFKNGLSDRMQLRYVAWGNARNNTGPVSL